MHKRYYLILFLCIGIGSFSAIAVAQPAHGAREVVGWHWYNLPPASKKLKKTKKPHHPKTPTSPLAQMRQLHTLFKTAMAKAMLKPTEQNVVDAMLLNRYFSSQSERFTQMWQKALLDEPGLNYGLIHPWQNNAQHVVLTTQRQHALKALAYYRKQDGLFFFYRGNNPVDQLTAKTVSRFAKHYHLAFISISVDGKKLSTLPATRLDHGQANALKVHFFPAILLVNPKTKQVLPIHYGFVSENELLNQFLAVASNFKAGYAG